MTKTEPKLSKIEQEIYEKYKLPDYTIKTSEQFNPRTKKAIHEAYEAGRLNAKKEDYEQVESLKPKLTEELMEIIKPEIEKEKAITANAIFVELDKGFIKMNWHGDDGRILPFLEALKDKYLPQNPKIRSFQPIKD